MARDFFARQGAFLQICFVYFKKKQCSMAEKDPTFGRFVVFQTRPSISALLLCSHYSLFAFHIILFLSSVFYPKSIGAHVYTAHK